MRHHRRLARRYAVLAVGCGLAALIVAAVSPVAFPPERDLHVYYPQPHGPLYGRQGCMDLPAPLPGFPDNVYSVCQ